MLSGLVLFTLTFHPHFGWRLFTLLAFFSSENHPHVLIFRRSDVFATLTPILLTLANCTTMYIFLGHTSNNHSFHCYNPSTKKIIISYHVIFDEATFHYNLFTPNLTPLYEFLHGFSQTYQISHNLNVSPPMFVPTDVANKPGINALIV